MRVSLPRRGAAAGHGLSQKLLVLYTELLLGAGIAALPLSVVALDSVT